MRKSGRTALHAPAVVLYGASGCHLCEEAAQCLEGLRRRARFTLRHVDIHSDSDLERRYLLEIPVVTVDGVEVSRGPVDPAALRAALGADASLTGRLRRLLGQR